MEGKPFYCYRLKYPSGFIADDGTDLSDVVFYVGKGQGVRMYEHEAEARSKNIKDSANIQKINAIRSIWARGMEVQKEVFFETGSEHDALLHEAQDILENAGIYLTNRYRPSALTIRNLIELADPARRNNDWVHDDVITHRDHPVFVLTQSMIDRMIYD